LECQRRTGAVISNQARFRREQITLTGKSTAWTRMAESGNALTFHFCPTCGSTVYWEGQGFPGYVAVAISTFADPNFPGPEISVWEIPDIPGSLSRPRRHPSACQSRAEGVSLPEVLSLGWLMRRAWPRAEPPGGKRPSGDNAGPGRNHTDQFR
jgi:hypothetical protein